MHHQDSIAHAHNFGHLRRNHQDTFPFIRKQRHQPVNFRLCANIDPARRLIKSILHSLGIQINSITEIGMGLTVPSYRVDVQRDVDVIEEILRVYGYNNVEAPSKVSASMAHAN